MLVAIGVRPAVAWLDGSGLRPRGVRVDAQGHTSLPRVFAARDAAGTGHWDAASRGGPAVADALLGRPQRPPAPPSFWTDQHCLPLVCVGEPRDAHEVLADGDLAGEEVGP